MPKGALLHKTHSSLKVQDSPHFSKWPPLQMLNTRIRFYPNYADICPILVIKLYVVDNVESEFQTFQMINDAYLSHLFDLILMFMSFLCQLGLTDGQFYQKTRP